MNKPELFSVISIRVRKYILLKKKVKAQKKIRIESKFMQNPSSLWRFILTHITKQEFRIRQFCVTLNY